MYVIFHLDNRRKELVESPNSRYIKRVAHSIARSALKFFTPGLLVALLLVCGCQSRQQPPRGVTQIPEAESHLSSPAPVTQLPLGIPTKVPQQPEPSVVPPVPATLQPRQTANTPTLAAPKHEWMPLSDWCLSNGLASSRKIPGDHLVVEARSAAGRARLTLGSHTATWNGIEFWLGFAPKVRNGELLVHGLDLEKHLRPLLLPARSLSLIHRTVVIDPGHGGENTGAKSVIRSAFEKDYALDWAKRLAPLLAANGWQVFLTRTNDKFISLSERVAFAQEKKADLFVSLHLNSILDHADQKGLETYSLTPRWMPSQHSRDGGEPIAIELPGNAHDDANFATAMRIHTAILKATGATDRGVRRARFMGALRAQTQPAVLVEGGYLTSPQEAKNLDRPEYRQRLAEAVASALP